MSIKDFRARTTGLFLGRKPIAAVELFNGHLDCRSGLVGVVIYSSARANSSKRIFLIPL